MTVLVPFSNYLNHPLFCINQLPLHQSISFSLSFWPFMLHFQLAANLKRYVALGFMKCSEHLSYGELGSFLSNLLMFKQMQCTENGFVCNYSHPKNVKKDYCETLINMASLKSRYDEVLCRHLHFAFALSSAAPVQNMCLVQIMNCLA